VSAVTTAGQTHVGRSLLRVEDGPLLVGRGQYLDDLRQPGQLTARIVRSEVAHGRLRAVTTDAALSLPGVVAQGTSFGLCWVEAGKAFFKASVLGDEPPLYTLYLPRPTSIADSPNAIVRAKAVIAAIEQWAERYEREHTYRCEGGTVVPKMSVNAIRSGVPYKITKTPSICELYVDTRITPEQDVRSVERELRAVLDETGIPTVVEPFVFRRGYEAPAQDVKPLVEHVEAAHDRIFGGRPGRPIEAITSMWRDSNVFIEAGIPTVVYGPGASVGGGNFAMEIDDLVQAAQVYAALAIEVCGVASLGDQP
jgi:hypothetical protein